MDLLRKLLLGQTLPLAEGAEIFPDGQSEVFHGPYFRRVFEIEQIEGKKTHPVYLSVYRVVLANWPVVTYPSFP